MPRLIRRSTSVLYRLHSTPRKLGKSIPRTDSNGASCHVCPWSSLYSMSVASAMGAPDLDRTSGSRAMASAMGL